MIYNLPYNASSNGRRRGRGAIRHVAIMGDSNAVGQGDAATGDNGLSMASVYSGATIETAISFTPPAFQLRRDLQPWDVLGGPNMGIELSMGRELVRSGCVAPGVLPMSKIAVNGTTLPTWLNPTNTNRVLTFLDDQETATGIPVTDVCWNHGANDAGSDANSAAYGTNFAALVAAVDAHFPGRKIFWWINLLNINTSSAAITAPRRDAVRAAQIAFCIANPTRSRIINLDNLKLGADLTHYDANGQWSSGIFFARNMAWMDPNASAGPYPWIQSMIQPVHGSETAGIDVSPHAPPVMPGDLELFFVSMAGNNFVPTLSPSENYIELPSSPQTSLASGVRQKIACYSRLVTESALVAAGGYRLPEPVLLANDQRRKTLTMIIRGAAQDGSAIHAVQGSHNDANSTVVSIPGVNTSIPGCLIIYAQAHYSAVACAASGWDVPTLPGSSMKRDSIDPGQQGFTIYSGVMSGTGDSGPLTGLRAGVASQANLVIAIKA
jgi:carbohydrate esterase-like sialic acid-specific acetylesterase